MRKLLFSFLVFCAALGVSKRADAQWVTIPDANFVTWLTANYPTCMSGNQMDTTCSGIVNDTIVACQFQDIHDLTGIQYFDSLRKLVCYNDSLASFPILPHFVNNIDCAGCQLNSISTLPPLLKYFWGIYNNLTSLPTFPNTIIEIVCYENQLTSLPNLPNSLTSLDCSFNNLHALPTLPNSLIWLDCSYNPLMALPSLPNALNFLNCENDSLTSLPSLPVCRQGKLD